MTPEQVRNHLGEILRKAVHVNSASSTELGRELSRTEGLLIVIDGLELTTNQLCAVTIELGRLAIEAENSKSRIAPGGLDEIGQSWWSEAAIQREKPGK